MPTSCPAPRGMGCAAFSGRGRAMPPTTRRPSTPSGSGRRYVDRSRRHATREAALTRLEKRPHATRAAAVTRLENVPPRDSYSRRHATPRMWSRLRVSGVRPDSLYARKPQIFRMRTAHAPSAGEDRDPPRTGDVSRHVCADDRDLSSPTTGRRAPLMAASVVSALRRRVTGRSTAQDRDRWHRHSAGSG
jgi:hypothetical protein